MMPIMIRRLNRRMPKKSQQHRGFVSYVVILGGGRAVLLLYDDRAEHPKNWKKNIKTKRTGVVCLLARVSKWSSSRRAHCYYDERGGCIFIMMKGRKRRHTQKNWKNHKNQKTGSCICWPECPCGHLRGGRIVIMMKGRMRRHTQKTKKTIKNKKNRGRVSASQSAHVVIF